MKRKFFRHEPTIYEAIGNGSYYYRWDIVKEADTPANEPYKLPQERWSCNEVVVWERVTPNKITQAAITAMWGEGIEQKIQNDYNAATLEILDESFIEKYKSFLIQRKSLKEQVEADCAKLGIV